MNNLNFNNMKKITFLIASIFMLITSHFFATDHYVKAGGVNSNSGSDEANALSTVSQAITNASDGDRIIIVGSISQIGQVGLSKSVSFVGQSNATVNGVDGGTVAKMYVLTVAGLTVSFTDIIFQGSINKSVSNGGVFSITGDSDISFTNCTFDGNSLAGDYSGGAISMGVGKLTITNSLFKNNTAGKSGGAISVFASTIAQPQVTIIGTTFYNNLAQGTGNSDGGGAIFAEGNANGTISITNCTFFENKITRDNLDYGGAVRSSIFSISVTNSLFYNNKIDGGAGASSDFGSAPGGTQSFTSSIGEWISSNVDTRSNFISYVKGTIDPLEVAADLTASNLRFNETTGKVEYDAVDQGVHSPINFGSDGNDAGAWDSGLTLSLEDSRLLSNNLSIYYETGSKNIKLFHSLTEPVSVEVYNILGSKVIEKKSIISKEAILNATTLKSGVYILVAKSGGNSISKKFLVY
jgi:predicted outer membrane repeat protein